MLQQAVTDGTALSEQLDMNLSIIRERTGDSPDIIIRRLDQVVGCEIRAAVIFIDGLVKDQIINHSIMDSLTQVSSMEIPPSPTPTQIVSLIQNRFLSNGTVSELNSMDQLLNAVLAGNTAILVNGSVKGVLASSFGGEQRSGRTPVPNRYSRT